MKKNFKSSIAAVLCGIMCLSLCACGNASDAGLSETVTGSTAENVVRGNETKNSDSEEDTDKTSAESADSETSETDEENVPEDGHYFNIDSPAPVGEWVTSAERNSDSKQQEIIYWRIVSVTEDAQESVEAYNNGGHFWILEQPEKDFIKYYEVEYEIKYPEDYTSGDYGIRSNDLGFWAENPDGAGWDKDGTTYIGLGQCFDVTDDILGKSDTKPNPGDTVTKKSVFTMMEGSPNFVFSYDYEDIDGERKTSYAASR